MMNFGRRCINVAGCSRNENALVNKNVVIITLLVCLVATEYLFGKNANDIALESSINRFPKREGPFDMPLEGNAYDIFQPLYDMNDAVKDEPMMAPPAQMINTFEERISWADTMVSTVDLEKVRNGMTKRDHAKKLYTETIKSFVSGLVYGDAELSLRPTRDGKPGTVTFDVKKRKGGRDWPYVADTMTGIARLNNVHDLLQDVIANDVKGDYIETGVWRGGSSIFAKASLSAFELDQGPDAPHRVSYVCDSFRGLPPGDKNLHKNDNNWDNTPYLEVSAETVANNFIKYGLLDSNVVFARGFFNETMPPLSKVVQSLSVMRLDGDMYESTVDVLYNLYDKLSIGGYVIIDDWTGFPAKDACEDFFSVHGINPEIIPIDKISAYWKKTENVEIQYWRYTTSKFT